jgi:predicted TIM-barrel fold metal-dependent hydrolase
METSNTIEYYALESMAAEIGADKILFGTGMPDKEPYDRIYQMVYCELPEDQIELIAYKNFERIMERGIKR